MRILVINAGSSSLKFELFGFDPETRLLRGEVERIGGQALLWVEHAGGQGAPPRVRAVQAPDHTAAVRLAIDALAVAGLDGGVDAVGHRVVHGGDRFAEPTLIDEAVLSAIEDVSHLAPLHNPANLEGICAARALLPGVPHVVVFDTAFHQTMPPHAREYALPRELVREHGIRRYGFHGTSHRYVAQRAAAVLGRRLEDLSLITLHLGAGASACAIEGGRSIDTSMGMTPLAGLVMGTRCGDVDPAIPSLLASSTGRTNAQVDALLNHDSGLLGMCGVSDMRDVHALIANGDADAVLALDTFCYRVRTYIGAYLAALGRLDALVFTAGIGEHDAEVRARICEGLDGLGISVDDARNREITHVERAIGADGSRVQVLVIPTDEGLAIARQTLEMIAASARA